MLTINDLHQGQELSSVEMRNVAGGTLNNEMKQAANQLGQIFKDLGCQDAAQTCWKAGDCAGSGGYLHC